MLFCQLAIGVLGVLVMSAEYGTGTIRATFAAAPRRPLVLAAKAVVFGAVALVVAEIVAFVSFFVGQALLSAPGDPRHVSAPGRPPGGRRHRALPLRDRPVRPRAGDDHPPHGRSDQRLRRHSAGAADHRPGVAELAPVDIRRFLPLRIGAVMMSVNNGGGGVHSFGPWTGFLVLCVYAAVVLVMGGVLLVRRDA